MDSPVFASEIIEVHEESVNDRLHRSVPPRSRARADMQSGSSQDDDDLEEILRAIDMRMSSSRARGMDTVRKNGYKRPARVVPSQAPSVTLAESVSLKQALRKICISQASELAAMKRLSMSNGSPCHSEAGTIKRLYSSLMVHGGESGRTSDEKVNPADGVHAGADNMPKDSIESAAECDFRTADQSRSTSLHSASSSSFNSQQIRVPDVVADGTVEIYDEDQVDNENEVGGTAQSCGSALRTSLACQACLENKIEPGSASSAVAPAKQLAEEKSTREPASSASELTECSTTKEKGACSQSSESSSGDYSCTMSVSDDSQSGVTSFRPHMSKDVRWTAIRHVATEQGALGLDNFKLLKRLGCGDIGTVYLAELIGSDCLFAVKVMDIEYLIGRKKMMRARTEREILQMLDHPFLPTLYAHFTTDNLSCLVMEYCPGGDLHVLRQKQPGRSFSEPAARFYVAEVLVALEYLHMLGVIYRDLKPENILVREDGHIMLSDFDLSLRCTVSPVLIPWAAAAAAATASENQGRRKPGGPCADSSCADPLCSFNPSFAPGACFVPRTASSNARKHKAEMGNVELPQLVAEPTDARSNSFVGTHEYLAPEIIRGDGHGSSVDWWTLGIFLYELLYGKTPFKGPTNDETLANVVSLDLRFPELPAVGSPARDLIRGLLEKDPASRLGSARGAAEIKQHPFFDGLNWALIRSAAPPDTPRSFDVMTSRIVRKRREGRCLDFRSTASDEGFEIF